MLAECQTIGLHFNLRGEDDEDVHPHTEIGEPPKLGESTDLTNDEASNREDEQAYDEAKFFFRELTNTHAVAENKKTNVQEELQTLENVGKIPRPLAVDTEGNVSIALQGVAVAIEGEEHLP